MAPGEFKAIRSTEPVVILISKEISSRNLIILDIAYDTVQQRKFLPIQEMKAAEMETMKRRVVRIPNRDGEEEGRRMKPE